MSAIAEKVAADHDIVWTGKAHVCICREWDELATPSYVAHVAEVTEAAVRAQIAADIQAAIDALWVEFQREWGADR